MGKSIKETMQEFTVNQALKYLEGNPEENIPKLMAFVDRFCRKTGIRASGTRSEEPLSRRITGIS